MAEKTTIILEALMNVTDVESKIGRIQKGLKTLNIPKDVAANLTDGLNKLGPLLKDYKKQLNNGFSTQKDVNNFNTLGKKIDEVFSDIDSEIKKVNSKEIRLNVDLTDIKNTRAELARQGKDLENIINSTFNKIGDGLKKKNPNFDLSFLKQGPVAASLKPIGKELVEAFNTRDIERYRAAYEKLLKTISGMSASSKTKQNLAKQMGLDEKFINDADKVNAKITELFKILRIPDTSFGAFEEGKAKLESTDQALNKLLQDAQSRGEGAFSGIANEINNTQKAMHGLTSETSSYGDSMATAAGQVRDLQQSTQYFFSLRNMLNLLKRGIDDAVQSVKELDAAMTETAVVTDYKVSDLWGMLPQYTQLANQLGATTQGAYETMTLYFQQGLDQQAAFEIGAETMKMARIAGLDYAETTDMMTAALRGFNMELNETSAKRINDVYSELAAITASDTEELGTAMQRTASIAHSAGMSFEGTTAFLAQAIETTREPAENIGTAMKTIVARFQEMKQNPLKISEVDGEEVDYNKVDAALQSIGVSLKDTNGQFRELDQVFLDISSRWDGLSQTQQRYIATVAAGSRQQSRFIAMMDNYDRTVQLFEAANNSAGASDEQFGKTMDSLESKLNKLHNAWQQFTMGIANNSMIKLAVDGMTSLLTITNKLIDTFSLGFGPLKSFLSIFTAFTGLKMAGRAANSLIGGLGGLVDPQSTVKEGLKTGLFGQGKTAAQASAIYTPIVNSLHTISQQINQIIHANNSNGQSDFKITSKQQYGNIKKRFGQLSTKEGFQITDASALFGELDAQHQRSLFNNSPGTQRAMKKASMSWFNSKGLTKELTGEGKKYINAIYKGMKDGQISVDKGLNLIGRPDLWGEHFATDTAQAISQHFSQKAEQAAQKGAWRQLNMKGATDEAKKAFLTDGKNFEKYNQLVNENYQKALSGVAGGHGKAKGVVSDLGRFSNDVGAIGDRFTQAGYGISAFGNALSQLGGPLGAVGTGISAFGGAISTMGMTVSGATGIISLFTEGLVTAEGTVLVAGSTIAAIAAPLAAAAAAFLLVRAHLKKVKEAGEEVTNTFNETNKTAEDNVSKLKSYQTEFATLSQGVDSNGNNVSLDDSQYQRYLEIVDDIAKINPEIVQGYNAQGHAIIDNNKALDETLKKQQQIKKEALDTYTDKASLQKLINARNINSDYKKTQTQENGVNLGYGHGNEGRAKGIGSSVPLAGDVSSIADRLRLLTTKDALGKTLKVNDDMLRKYGIESMDALIEGEDQAVKNFIKHRDKIQAELTNSGFELSESLIKGFDKLNEDQKAFDEAIQPVYDNLLASVSSSPFYKELNSEFRSAIALGLKDIASQDLSASEMQSQANTLVQEFDNLTRAGGEYATAMEQVESAQDQFASSLDASEYAKNTESALNTLNSLLKEYEGNTTAYGQAVTEYLTNQIEKIKNFTEEGATSLTEALNGMTSTISAAEGAYDAFQESTKTDFSTGAQSMKSIFEEVTKETDGVMLHMEKFGDGTMWKGARALLGDEFVEKNGENVELVKKELLSLKNELQDGEKGFRAFWDNFKKVDDSKIEGFTWNKDGSYSLDRDINPDAYKEIAEQMHRSEEYVVSMLNKGRQFASINFTNIDDVRKALSTDTATIAGTGTTGGNTDLYVKKDYLQNAMSDAGIVNPAEQVQETEKLLAKGIKIIPDANDVSEDTFKNMGISDIPSLIKTFGDTGQFNRSEIEEYAQQMQGYNAQEFGTLYQDYLDSQEHPELPTLTNIESNVQTIASIIGSNRIEQGYADENTIQAYEEAKKAVNGENGHNKGEADSISELFALGKNREHEGLSESEYQSTLKLLDKQIDEYTRASQEYEKGAKKAEQEGRDFDAKELLKEAHGYAELAKRLEEDKAKGEQVHQNLQNAEESTKQKAAGMPSDVNQILDKQTQAKQEQAAADQKRAEGLAKQTEEIVKQKEEQAAAEQKRAEGLVKQTEEYAKQKQEQEVKEQADWQHNKENYEQQAKNAAGPTKSLEAQAQEKIEKEATAVETGMSQKLDTIDIGSIKRLGSSLLEKFQKGFNSGAEEQTDKFIIGPEYAAYTGQASETFSEKIKTKALELGSILKEGYDSLTQAESSIPTQNTNFGTKVLTAAQKLGIAIKQGYDALQNIQPPTSTPVAPTISKGASALSTTTQEVVQKVITQESGVDETQQKLETISSTANQGATMPVSAAMDATVTAAQTALQKLKGNASKGASVKTTVDSKGADTARSAASKPAEMPLKIRDLATPVINRINASAKKPVTKTVNVSPNYTGTWRKDVYVGLTGPGANKAATGVNNKISFHHVPLIGSLARGTKKGRVGPRGQGGPTLTGEEGYEIAWLPEESRSMILGANGPQMIDLPKDAIVWNHEQSKEIMKRRAIPFGSMDDGNYDDGDGGSSDGGKKKKKKKKKKSKKKSKKKKNKDKEETSSLKEINNFSIEEVVRFDTDRNLEALTSNINKLTKQIDNNLGKIGTKASDISGSIKEQVKNLQAVKANNDALAASYQRDLDNLDNGGYTQKISYENGGDKNAEEYVNLSNYVYKDGNGTYQIDIAGIAASGTKERQEAIYKAVESALNPLVSGLKKAQDAADDAEKQIEELGKKVSEAFYQWENEITEVYDLTQRLNNESSLRGRFASQVSLELAKLDAGFGNTAQSIGYMQKALARDNKTLVEQIKNQHQMISARQRELQEAFSAQDELDNLNRLRNKSYNSEAEKKATVDWAQQQYNAANLGRKYLSNIRQGADGNLQYEINWQKFNQDQKNNPYNKETYDAIKKYLDDLNSAATEYNNAIKDQTDAIKETYEALKEYQEYVADFEDTLLQGLEKQIEEEADNMKNLSDSISNALKDLLDEVRRKLDERRKQEDNQKTEAGISQKQQRLAMLRADTSGGNAVEIARLEQELGESTQSYERTLEDQLLDRMQQQADKAEQQREQIIALTQAQNTIAAANNRELVNMWMKNPVRYKEEIRNAWLEAQEFDEKGDARQAELKASFESGYAKLIEAVKQTDLKGNLDSGVASLSGILNQLNQTTSNIFGKLNPQGTITAKNTNAKETKVSTAPPKAATPAKAATPKKTAPAKAATPAPKVESAALQRYKRELTKPYDHPYIARNDFQQLLIYGQAAGVSKAQVQADLKKKGIKGVGAYMYGMPGRSMELLQRFATGGLSTQTGPAWLDGTPSKPELVLNAQDTKNFIALKDVLSKVLNSTDSIGNTYGGNATYEININVDHLNNDYDVDKVVERVKKKIVQDSGYRNVTQVRKFR